MEPGLYEVKFQCTNCRFIFIKILNKGTTALGRAGACPNCGCSENSVGNSKQKIGVFPIITDRELLDPEFDKYEILLETDNITIKKKKERSEQ
jgi:hypothetical protein